MAINPFLKFSKGGTATQPQPSDNPFLKFTQPVQPVIPQNVNLGLPPIGGMKTPTPAVLPQKLPQQQIGVKETLKQLTPETISEAGGKVIGAVGGFAKTIGQGIARSFIAASAELKEQLLVPKAERKQFGEATYIPQNETEKKIFGTDKSISFKTIGEEILAIGGEDFKQKWGSASIPLGMVIAGLDITPIGFGKKELLKNAAKVISKTEDVGIIVKTLKQVVKGSDDEIEFLAKSLTKINKEDEVLTILETTGKVKQATPFAQKAIKEAIPAEKGIIPQELQPLAQEARKYKSAEELFRNQIKTEIPISRIGGLEPQPAPFPKTKRKITEPVELVYTDQGDFILEVGNHRYHQAVFNKDKTIPAIVRFEKEGATDFFTQAVKGVKEVKPTKMIDEFDLYLEKEFGKITPEVEQKIIKEEKDILTEAFKREAAIIKKETEGQLFKDIRARGGIKSYRGGFLAEEMRPIPINLRNNKGLPLDEMAESLKEKGYNFEGGEDLLQAILSVKSQVFGTKKSVIGTLNTIRKFAPARISGRSKELLKDPIQRIIAALRKAKPLRKEQEALYSAERAKRTARVAAFGEKISGEKGFFAQLGQLKGELPKVQFEAIRNKFTQAEIDSLFDTIEKTKTLLPLEKISTKGGLMKLLDGAVPTKSEIELLREVFPKELIDAVLARRPLLEKIREVVGEIINVPRTLMATLDLSAPLRQGVFMLGRPIRFAQAFKDMFKFAVSEKAYQGLIEGIKARPTYLKMKQGGLALTEIGGPLLKREERFMSNLAEKIPGYGALVRGSNRAYTGFLNKLRADIFDDILKKAEIIGREPDDSLLESIADFVNAGTGRGKFGLLETGILPKSMEKAAVVMNGVFFSPRLMASRLNLLNPYFYIQLDPLVRKEAIKTLFATSGILGSIYGLWKLNGGEVGIDPRSADFGKIKIGNTRYDILGGFQQYIKLAAQLITGEIISSTTGRTITLGEGYKPLTRKDIILRFFEYKTSPIASFTIGLLTGTTAVGEDVDIPTEAINRFIPMVVQDLYDISQEEGAEGLLYGLPAIFGVGLQTYGKQELAVGESKLGEPTTQIRPVPELAEKIRELVMGQIPLGTSKGFSVETYFDQLSNLPREEARNIFNKIAETNPELAKKLSDVVKERELGITVKDKDLKAKGVASGDRALAIKKELGKLKTKGEKKSLWNDYVRKGVITKDVAKQLEKLLNQ